jgi:hypothetical protein
MSIIGLVSDLSSDIGGGVGADVAIFTVQIHYGFILYCDGTEQLEKYLL